MRRVAAALPMREVALSLGSIRSWPNKPTSEGFIRPQTLLVRCAVSRRVLGFHGGASMCRRSQYFASEAAIVSTDAGCAVNATEIEGVSWRLCAYSSWTIRMTMFI